MELIVVKAAVIFLSSHIREPRTGAVPPWISNIFKNTYFTVSCSANICCDFCCCCFDFSPHFFHMQHRPFTKRTTGGFLRIMIQEKRKGTPALGCFLFTNLNQEASVPSHVILQSCLVLKTTTKPQNYSATTFSTLPWNNSDTEHPTALGLVFFSFYLCFVKEQFL